MAAGEAACISVHGANRLGCNSLLDIVVFGRAAALRCAEKLTAKATQPELPADAGDGTLARFDRLRNAKGGTPTPALRLQMQRAMQSYATVFRTGTILQEGKEALREVWNGLSDIAVSDRSMVWNSDLIETLEFEKIFFFRRRRWWIRPSPARRAVELTLARISRSGMTKIG